MIKKMVCFIILSIALGSTQNPEAQVNKIFDIKVHVVGQDYLSVKDRLERFFLKKRDIRVVDGVCDYEINVVLKEHEPEEFVKQGYIASVAVVGYYEAIAADLPIFKKLFLVTGPNDIDEVCRRIVKKVDLNFLEQVRSRV